MKVKKPSATRGLEQDSSKEDSPRSASVGMEGSSTSSHLLLDSKVLAEAKDPPPSSESFDDLEAEPRARSPSSMPAPTKSPPRQGSDRPTRKDPSARTSNTQTKLPWTQSFASLGSWDEEGPSLTPGHGKPSDLLENLDEGARPEPPTKFAGACDSQPNASGGIDSDSMSGN